MTDVESLFAAAAPLGAAERAALLDRDCPDPLLRERVGALLRAHDRAGHFLDQPPAAPTSPVAEGTLVAGRYKLLEQIGEGGMGTVWVAEQIAPVKRKVALKLVKAGMDSNAVLARFEAERQALAMMDHPGIAKVLDGGITETGRPFFVMEYVKGVPITEYCDATRLDVPRRLALFVQVCQAVQHAHSKGIIHRDLKPSNILVAPYDGTPVPKVIDFGLAKAIHQPLTERTLHTAHETVLGTPLYMSPEQAQLNNLDIDTRSDVYSLGVLFYELLTGTTPLLKQRVGEVAWDEIRRVIREEEPQRPSTRLSSTDTLPSLAAFRQTEPGRLTRQVRGELDWIAMKALEKDRARRYATAEALARDIGRYLGDEPVEARPASARYRLSKFVRRHRLPVAAAAVALLALVSGILGTTWGLLRARESRRLAEAARDAEAEQKAEAVAQRDKAVAAESLAAERLALVEEEQGRTLEEKRRAEASEERALEEKRIADAVRDFLLYKLLGQADTTLQANALLDAGGFAASADRNVTVRELLDRAAAEMTPERAEVNFPDQPLLQAALLETLGNAYRGVGEFEAAVGYLQRAAAVRLRQGGADHPETLRVLNSLAGAYKASGKLPEAIRLHEEVSDAAVRVLGPEDPFALTALGNLATAYVRSGKLPEAIRIHEQVRDAQLRRLGADHPATLTTLSNLAVAYDAAGRREEAARILEQVGAASERALGPDHPETLKTLGTLGLLYVGAGRLAEASRVLERVREAAGKKFGPDHPEALRALHNLALAYQEAGRVAEATPILEQVLAAELTKLGPDHPSTVTTLSNLAGCYLVSGRANEAIPILERIGASEEKMLGADHPDHLTTLNNLAAAYQAVGRLPEAIDLFERVGQAMEKKLGPSHPDTLSALENLATAYREAQQWDKSIRVLEELLRRREAIAHDEPRTIHAMAMLGTHHRSAGHLDKAIPLLEEAYRNGGSHPALLWTADALVDAYVDAGRVEEAAKLTEESLAAARRQVPPESPQLANALVMAGKHLVDVKRYDAAEAILRDCVALREKLKDAVPAWQVASARSLLGAALLGQRKYAEAEPLLLAGAQGLSREQQAMPPTARSNVAASIQRLVDLYDATGRTDEAAGWRKELETHRGP